MGLKKLCKEIMGWMFPKFDLKTPKTINSKTRNLEIG